MQPIILEKILREAWEHRRALHGANPFSDNSRLLQLDLDRGATVFSKLSVYV